MILLIDNYDSFSYNLYQLVGEIDPDIRVIRNDEMTVEEIRQLNPDRIILSPGPGRPENAGVIIDVIKQLGKDFKILGVCLGHQAICSAYGATITYAKELMHGKQSDVTFDKSSLFKRDTAFAMMIRKGADVYIAVCAQRAVEDEADKTFRTCHYKRGDAKSEQRADYLYIRLKIFRLYFQSRFVGYKKADYYKGAYSLRYYRCESGARYTHTEHIDKKRVKSDVQHCADYYGYH